MYLMPSYYFFQELKNRSALLFPSMEQFSDKITVFKYKGKHIINVFIKHF